MSADIYDWALNKSMMTFDRWVTVLRLACLQRRKLALLIDESDCSSWPTATATDSRVNEARPPEKMIRKDGRNVLRTPSLAETVLQPLDFPYTKQDIDLAHQQLPYQVAKAHWPTATATDGEKGGPNSRHGNGTLHLAAAAVQTLWYTPNCPNGGRTNPAEMSLTGEMPDGRKRQVGLENQAKLVWPTPMANPNTNRQTKPTPSQMKGEHGLNLAMVAVQSSWPTPRTCAGKRSSGSNRTELVNSWATPQAHDVSQGNPDRVGRFGTAAGGRNLNDEGVAWATPMSRDWKDGAATSDNLPTNSILGRQAPRSMKNGNASTLTLNPLFVEWLMGWPIGWTDCASAVTGLSPWLPLMRSELSRLLQASTSDQLDLFT
jgi:DNA (cytosine-5)-methyltransferase 1